MKIADKLEHPFARAGIFCKRRNIGNAKEHGGDLCASDVALIECVGDRLQATCFRRHIDRQTIESADLFGEFFALARMPRVFIALLQSNQKRNGSDESAVRVA